MSKKILFVDDSPVIKKIVQRTVEASGYEFLGASDGKEALGVLDKESSNIKLILSDWNMPIMNGYDFLKAAKKSNTFKHIPVIMITTEGEKSNINKAIQAGAANYLLKPFNPEDLQLKIKQTALE
ncbi:MAG: response regulator [Vallitaleaceae bacterium]|nr:response regulator [Vallitaleaceae bacterium]